jgi:hypothetical protein
MNRLHRPLLIVVALLLITIPIALLVAHYGVALRGLFSAATGVWPFYAGAGVSLTLMARVSIGIAAALLALLGVAMVLAETAASIPDPAPSIRIQDDPGRETLVKGDAVANLIAASSTRAGAVEPVVRLHRDERGYDVELDVRARHSTDLHGLTGEIRQEVSRELARQHIPVRRLQVIVTDLT